VIYHETEHGILYQGDCLDIMRSLPDNSVDAVVTDPPYGLSFMGKKWDYAVPSVEIWAECLRVLKPGGYLLSFAGTRTQHRIACGIEDAGFEIRDMIAWVYGSGFPKSLDVGKAIDKINGETGRLLKFTQWMRTTGMRPAEATTILRNTGAISPNGTMAGHFFANDIAGQPAIPTPELWAKIRPHIAVDIPEWVDKLVERIEAEREIVGKAHGKRLAFAPGQNTACPAVIMNLTAPATPEAKEWNGFGTALKPALEPITVARKPIEGTVAENVLKWGTGAINIDGCRVGSDRQDTRHGGGKNFSSYELNPDAKGYNLPAKRFPANLIHDGSDEVLECFPNDAARFFYCAKASKAERNAGLDGMEERIKVWNGQSNKSSSDIKPVEERWTTKMQNTHPTVKPIALMEYLIKLVAREGYTVLDPFLGSGTTAIACVKQGRKYIGCEMDKDYCEIAKRRIDAELEQPETGGLSPTLPLQL
jgi:DNA modification methylase